MTCRRSTTLAATLVSSAAVALTATVACGQAATPEAAKAPAASTPMTAAEAKAFIEAQDFGPALDIGDKAPPLSVADWAQGDPISSFEKGSTYVVEMWAEWCGPCIRAIPHVNSLHEKYQKAGKPVEFIGMNIWDDKPGEDAEARLARIKRFVDKQGDTMTYRVAIERTLPTAEGERPQGVMARDWMEAAGRNGIPCAFIVDGEGEVAWIGHPMSIDEPLAKVVAGTWDKSEASAANTQASRANKGPMLLQRSMENLRSSDDAAIAEAYKTLEALSLTLYADEPRFFPWVAQQIATGDGIESRNFDLAKRMAQMGCDMTSWNEPQAIGVLGLTHVAAGEGVQGQEFLSMAMRIGNQNADDLNAIAWMLLDEEDLIDLTGPFALGMSRTAAELTGEKNGDMLDTYAKALWLTGSTDLAIEKQRLAVETAENPEARAAYERTLAKYEAAN